MRDIPLDRLTSEEEEKKDNSSILGQVTAGADNVERGEKIPGRYEPSISSSGVLQERTLGVWSGIFLIMNKIIGAGIFSTPGTIFRLSGSVGLSLFLWVIAGLIATCGSFIYLEFGTGIPRSGGLKNYLERAYSPRLAATCIYAFYCVFLQVSASNAITFSTYVLAAAGVPSTTWKLRGISIAGITFVIILFIFTPRLAMAINNVTGAVKIFMLLFIICTGFAALAGHLKIDDPHNFTDAFEGTTSDAYNIATALLNAIFAFGGYDNANAVLSEVIDPVRTLKIVLPSSIALTSVLYMLANIAYFAGVSKAQMKASTVTVAATLFKNVFGDKAATKALPALVAISALGHLVGIAKTVPVIIQELAKEDVLIFNNVIMSNKPFRTPIGALVLHWLVTILFICAPPAGDAFSFVVSLSSYSGTVISVLVTIGLLKIRRGAEWSPPFRCPWPLIVFFLAGSSFLLAAPFIPPHTNSSSIPYYLSSVVGLAIISLGIPYYLIRFRWGPKLFGYDVASKVQPLSDGSAITRYRYVKRGSA